MAATAGTQVVLVLSSPVTFDSFARLSVRVEHASASNLEMNDGAKEWLTASLVCEQLNALSSAASFVALPLSATECQVVCHKVLQSETGLT